MPSGKYRTSSADAIAYLLGKNLVILNETNEVKHEYFFPDIQTKEILYLVHIGNWHFNKLKDSLP